MGVQPSETQSTTTGGAPTRDTTTAVMGTTQILSKTTGTSTSSSSGNAKTATSGVDGRRNGHELLFILEGVVLGAVAVIWVFGWI